MYILPRYNEIYCKNGKEGMQKKFVLTIEKINDILKHLHNFTMGGHSSVNVTLQKISNYYRWDGMKEVVQEYVS